MLTNDEINAAIRACLDECYASKDHLACLAEQVAELRKRPGWTEAGVAQVQLGAVRMLRILLDPAEAQLDASNSKDVLTS